LLHFDLFIKKYFSFNCILIRDDNQGSIGPKNNPLNKGSFLIYWDQLAGEGDDDD